MSRFFFYFEFPCWSVSKILPFPQVYLKQTAQHIVSEQSPKKLMEVRGRLYELLTHCIPPDVIFVGLLRELVKICDGELKTEVRICIWWACFAIKRKWSPSSFMQLNMLGRTEKYQNCQDNRIWL